MNKTTPVVHGRESLSANTLEELLIQLNYPLIKTEPDIKHCFNTPSKYAYFCV